MDIKCIYDLQDLTQYLAEGNRVKYLYFWGHQNKNGSIGKSCFSQWYEAAFELDKIEYLTAEHYMMAEKARLFNDSQMLEKILAASNPGLAKKLGRSVTGFDQSIWLKHRRAIVVRGNVAKFGQNAALKEFLLNTRDRILVEASPRDRIWGIGLDQNHADAANPYRWKGLNLLGFSLMEVRNILKG
ncbi:MAG: NADAR family protein [Cyanobacteria bacterium J06623_7]